MRTTRIIQLSCVVVDGVKMRFDNVAVVRGRCTKASARAFGYRVRVIRRPNKRRLHDRAYHATAGTVVVYTDRVEFIYNAIFSIFLSFLLLLFRRAPDAQPRNSESCSCISNNTRDTPQWRIRVHNIIHYTRRTGVPERNP